MAADIEAADRLEIERYGHTTYRRWSGWRKVMIAEWVRRSELLRQGQARVPRSIQEAQALGVLDTVTDTSMSP